MSNGTPRQALDATTGVIGIAAMVAVALVVISLVWIASEMHYRSCVAKVEARYPAVPVSAFARQSTTGQGLVRERAVEGRRRLSSLLS
jgi:cobalamin synthase